MKMDGSASWFGGPEDDDMKHEENTSFYEHHEADERPDLFLPRSSDLTQGVSKRLRCNDSYYLALNVPETYPRRVLKGSRWRVTNLKNQDSVICFLVDRGPSAHGRLTDMSKAALRAIGIDPDDSPENTHVRVQGVTGIEIPFGIYGWEEKKNKEG